MKTALLLAASLAVLTPAPLLAQSLHDTHEQVSMPAGKGPVLSFRPINRVECQNAATPHLPGKSPAATPMAPVSCDELASNERRARRAATASAR